MKKTIVGINPWVAHFNTEVFGPDAARFRPERWDPAETPPERLTRMEQYHIPFGAGTRTCLGKHIAVLEMNKLIPELVRRYEFELLDDELSCVNHWFTTIDPTRVRVKVAETS